MNKYIVAIHDEYSWNTWIESFNAESIEDCEHQLMDYLCELYGISNTNHFTDFIDILDELDINISQIYNAKEI